MYVLTVTKDLVFIKGVSHDYIYVIAFSEIALYPCVCIG